MTADPLRLAILGDGTHVNLQRWNHGLQSAGAETQVLSLRHRRISTPPSTRWLPTFRSLGRLNYVVAVPFVKQFLRNWCPDLLLAYYVTGYGIIGRLSGFHPLVQVTSGTDVLHGPEHRFLRPLVRANLAAADLVTAWAPHMAEAAHLFGVPSSHIFTLPAGIKADMFHNYRIPEPAQDDSLRMIVTRGLRSFNKIEVLVEVARVLRHIRVDFTLSIVGDGPERKALNDLIDAYGLQERVKLLGFVPNDELGTVLAQHNTYISLTPSDGVSASLLEAMAVGLMPIAPNHPANSNWIIDGENGLLLDDLSPYAIASAIERANWYVRLYAWQRNPSIVSDRGDLYHNASQFIKRFRELVVNC